MILKLSDMMSYMLYDCKSKKIRFDEILYVESMREYVSIHVKERRFVIHKTMTKMEKELPSDDFMRVHRSFIAGLNHIESINGNMIVMGEKNIPIGASYRKQFFEQVRLL